MGLTIGFLALIVIVGATIWLVERGNSLFEQSALQRSIRIVAVDLRDHLRTAESSQRGFLLTGNEIYLAPYDTSKTRARQELDDLRRMIAPDAPNRAMLPRLSEAVGEKIAEMDNSIISSGCLIKGARLRNSIVRSEVLMEEDVELDDCIVMDYVVLRKGVRLKRVIVDRYNTIEAGESIGYDADVDRRRFTVTDSGIVVLRRGQDTDTRADEVMSRYL